MLETFCMCVTGPAHLKRIKKVTNRGFIECKMHSLLPEGLRMPDWAVSYCLLQKGLKHGISAHGYIHTFVCVHQYLSMCISMQICIFPWVCTRACVHVFCAV